MGSIRVSHVWILFSTVLHGYWNQMPHAIEMGNIVVYLCDGDDAEVCFRLYIDALNDELLSLLTSIASNYKSTSATHELEEHKVPQSGQTEVESRGFTVCPYYK
jgi:hypothetical protein